MHSGQAVYAVFVEQTRWPPLPLPSRTLTPERGECNQNRSAGAINYLQQTRTEGVKMCAPQADTTHLAQQIEDDDSFFTTVCRARAGCTRDKRVRTSDWERALASALEDVTVQHVCGCMPACLPKQRSRVCAQVCMYVTVSGPPAPSVFLSCNGVHSFYPFHRRRMK